MQTAAPGSDAAAAACTSQDLAVPMRAEAPLALLESVLTPCAHRHAACRPPSGPAPTLPPPVSTHAEAHALLERAWAPRIDVALADALLPRRTHFA